MLKMLDQIHPNLNAQLFKFVNKNQDRLKHKQHPI